MRRTPTTVACICGWRGRRCPGECACYDEWSLYCCCTWGFCPLCLRHVYRAADLRRWEKNDAAALAETGAHP